MRLMTIRGDGDETEVVIPAMPEKGIAETKLKGSKQEIAAKAAAMLANPSLVAMVSPQAAAALILARKLGVAKKAKKVFRRFKRIF